VGEMEFIHFEAIVHAQWNLRRCRKNEAVFLSLGADAFLDHETRVAMNTRSVYPGATGALCTAYGRTRLPDSSTASGTKQARIAQSGSPASAA
jgi:hypothetical protein